jgi:hypothetical protein
MGGVKKGKALKKDGKARDGNSPWHGFKWVMNLIQEE